MGKSILAKELQWISTLIFFICTIYACENDAFTIGKEGEFNFSTDTIAFDTIFTSQGTPTYKLLIRNPNNYKINLDSVYLGNRSDNFFILNINGYSGNVGVNIGIEAKDSLYIFIQSFVDENNTADMLMIQDSLVVVSGKHKSNVKLIAVAENVVSFNNTHIGSMEWNNQKPYLIQGTLTVDEGSVLKIEAGCRVYFHRNAKMVVNGQLIVDGSFEQPVSFRSDRLEHDYDTIPGQWGGIYLLGTGNIHQMNYALIRNGTIGITAGTSTTDKDVNLHIYNTKIANMGYSALICYHAQAEVYNCILANCSGPVCALLQGGNYDFTHCTLGDYGARYASTTYTSYALIMQNYLETTDENGTATYLYHDLEKGNFNNCILYGNTSNELSLSFKQEAKYNYTFENCLVKLSTSSPLRTDTNLFNCIIAEDPDFKSSYTENFHLLTTSPAINTGKSEFGILIPIDLDNQPRTIDARPDMGAYEYVNP